MPSKFKDKHGNDVRLTSTYHLHPDHHKIKRGVLKNQKNESLRGYSTYAIMNAKGICKGMLNTVLEKTHLKDAIIALFDDEEDQEPHLPYNKTGGSRMSDISRTVKNTTKETGSLSTSKDRAVRRIKSI